MARRLPMLVALVVVALALPATATATADTPARLGGAAGSPAEVHAAAIFNDTVGTAKRSGRDLRWFQSTVGAETEDTWSCTDVDSGSTARTFTDTAWYRFTGNGGRMIVNTFGSGYDTMLGAWEVAQYPNPGSAICDDDSNGGSNAQLVFNTRAGVDYYILVGGCSGCGATEGQLVVSILGADQAAHPGAFTGGSDNSTNVGALVDPGELVSCNGTGFSRTTWYAVTVPEFGTMRLTASSQNFTPTIAFFRSDARTRLGCGVGSSVSGIASSAVAVRAGTYLVQIGSANGAMGTWTYAYSFVADKDEDNDNQNRPTDCVDTDRSVFRGAIDRRDGKNNDCDRYTDEDADGDGKDATWAGGNDCFPNNKRLPAKEKPGNGRDENCDGKKAYRKLPTHVRTQIKRDNGVLSLYRLAVLSIKKGSTVKVKCTGGGCSRRTFTKKFKRARGSYDLMRAFGGTTFQTGTKLQIRATKRYWIAPVATLYRDGVTVSKREQCQRPGQKRLRKCG